jgi:hypothetical protein
MWLTAATMLFVTGCAGPILPPRTKPGGAAKWAETLAYQKALEWSPDATLVRVKGAGVGIEGWLPDKGGEWSLAYSSVARGKTVEFAVDPDGKVRAEPVAAGKEPPTTPVPRDWLDSPKVFGTTRAHWKNEPLHVLEAELSAATEPTRAPGQVVWRIRFWLSTSTTETHVVTADAHWVAMY